MTSEMPVKRGRGRPKGSKNKSKGGVVEQGVPSQEIVESLERLKKVREEEVESTPTPPEDLKPFMVEAVKAELERDEDREFEKKFPKVDKGVSGWKSNLEVGDRCRIQPGGPIYTVIRKSAGALYMRSGEIKDVTIEDKVTGESRSFAAGSNKLEAFALNSMVYRLEEGE